MRMSFRISGRLRHLAARTLLRLCLRRREIDRLFTLTAAAFGCQPPPSRGRDAEGLLVDYAHFTREHAEAALDGNRDLHALERRLFHAAFALGSNYRRCLGVHCPGDAMAAARLIYDCLGIDFRSGPEGAIEIRRCAFARVYSSRVCGLVSALDRGLVAALTQGGEMTFRQRLTEGAASCRAHITGGKQ
jgi:hypothetical protein